MAMRRMVASNGSSVEKLGASKLNNAQLGCWIHASSEVNAHAEQLVGQAASLAQEAIRGRGADWAHVQGLILQGGIEEGSVRGRQEISESRRWPPSTSPVPIFTASGTTRSDQATVQIQRLIPDNLLDRAQGRL